MSITTKLHLKIRALGYTLEQGVRRAWQQERGDVTSTVIIIAVLVAAAVAAGVVITTFISGQTSKIS
ncbi:hypothetical protein [Candidatus Poriferisocius sp.]|uniref:hypothetical protein n=1 Tax=Candidatus Poriferisocius sp. TaxID=3101276 RepID=UPI003B5A869D